MNNDLRYYGNPMNWESVKGDLISREALKKKLQARHDNGNEDFDKGYNIGLGTAIDLIDSAPAVEYTFEEAFQKTVCENRLYCPVRPQGKTNAELFKQTFGIYATELWSMKEADFLKWLNAEQD